MPSLLLRVSKCSCKFLLRWKRKICKIFVKSLFTKKTSSKGWNKCQKGCTYLIVVMKKFQKALILVFEIIVYYQIKHISFLIVFFSNSTAKVTFWQKTIFLNLSFEANSALSRQFILFYYILIVKNSEFMNFLHFSASF